MKRMLFPLIALVGLTGFAAAACTGVAIADGTHVVVGGNEDWTRFDAHVWAEAATEGIYGAVYTGYEIRGEFGPRAPYWFEFQGVNSEGLYFDTFGAPTLANPNWEGRPACPAHVEVLMMRQCASVEEAVALLGSYNLARYRHYNETVFRSNMQFFLADRTGTAAVVDGEHVHWMDGGYMVTTNFRLSDPSLGGWPCFRYDLATRMLEENATASIDRVAEILDATQFPCSHGYASCTRYSAICDLTDGQLALYFDGDFSRSVRLDITHLCDNGLERTAIQDLIESGADSTDAVAQVTH
jgi:choloylglycine hydrolase